MTPVQSVSQRVGAALSARHRIGRPDEKERRIAEAAVELFLANGYRGTAVDEIALKAGVSKQTIYTHFESKEKLFLAVAAAATDAVTDELAARLAAGPPKPGHPEEELYTFARTLARRVLDPEMIALRRLVMTEVVHFPELGRTWYAHGPGRVVEQLSQRFRQLADDRILVIQDLQAAAENFNWLVLSRLQNKLLFNAVTDVEDAEITRHADAAVDVFLAAYRHRAAGR